MLALSLMLSKTCYAQNYAGIIDLGQLVSRPHVQQKQSRAGGVISGYLLRQCAKVKYAYVK